MDNMKTLYIVSTYYHALIACIKQLRSDEKADILVTDYIPGYMELSEKLRCSSIFGQVLSVGPIKEYSPKNKVDYIFSHHRKNSQYIENQLDISLKEYDFIYIFHDDTWFAHYLKCAGTPYHLIEDALDSFKSISKSPFSYMLHKADLKSWVKNTFRVGYVFCGYDRFTKSVEVNDTDGIEIKHLARKKLKVLPRKPLFDSITNSELQLLKRIFMNDIPDFDDRKSALLITQPLSEDCVVSSEEKQIEVFKHLVKKYSEGLSLVIKPHPRDNADYYSAFPDAIILNKNMPIEIIALTQKLNFRCVISLSSTSYKSIKADYYYSEALCEMKL